MDKEKFKRACLRAGYANADTLRIYCKGRNNFNAEDFQKVFRFEQKRQSVNNSLAKYTLARGGKTSKKMEDDDDFQY